MPSTLFPSSVGELQKMVVDHPRVLAVGGRTKTRLSAERDDVQLVSTRGLSGITEYEPSEYTFTALAGTPLGEIHDVLRQKGQYLPCSALFRDSGATLGGAIGSGLSGSERFRFGGLRDFLLGVKFVAGDGKLISGGGKVVKNAAGFDIPKLMVGSLGTFGILTEATFKVFPRPACRQTLHVSCPDHGEAAVRMMAAAASRWELLAIDYLAGERRLVLRVGGPPESTAAIAREIERQWPGEARLLSGDEESAGWAARRELRQLPPGGCAIKVPVTPKIIPLLEQRLSGIPGLVSHYSVAGNVACLCASSPSDLPAVSAALAELNLRGMTFMGDRNAPLWPGRHPQTQVSAALKSAFDPLGRFPSLNAL